MFLSFWDKRILSRLSRKLRFSDNLCSDFAEHESSESSHAETFSLQKYKNRGTRPRFLCVCSANAFECALPRDCFPARKRTSSTAGIFLNRV